MRLGGRHEARRDLAAVEPDRAGAAVAGLAADLRAGEPEVVAQHVRQPAHRLDHGPRRAAPLTSKRSTPIAVTRSSPLERPTNERQRRVAAVGGRAANVVDRREVGEVLRPDEAGGRGVAGTARELRLERGQPLRHLRARADGHPRARDPPARVDLDDRGDHRDRDHEVGPRAELLERRARRRPGDRRGHEQARHELVRRRGRSGGCRSRIRRSARAARRAPTRAPRLASSASRLGMPSAAGDALQTLPTTVARAWIWSPPTARAPPRSSPSNSGGSGGLDEVSPGRRARRSASRPSTASTPRSPAIAVTSRTSSSSARPTRAG